MNLFSISSSPRGPELKASNIRPTVLLLRRLLKEARVCLSLSPAMCNLHLGVELPDQLRHPKIGLSEGGDLWAAPDSTFHQPTLASGLPESSSAEWANPVSGLFSSGPPLQREILEVFLIRNPLPQAGVTGRGG